MEHNLTFAHDEAASISFNETFLNNTNTSENSTNSKNPKKEANFQVEANEILVLLSLIIALILYIRRRRRKRRHRISDFKLEEIFQVKIEAPAKVGNEKRNAMQILPKNLVIDYSCILGKGSYATIYKASIINLKLQKAKLQRKPSEESTTLTAALKLPNKFGKDEQEQFIREMDSLITLQSHPHIITFYGWTLINSIPALLIEMADTDLLKFLRAQRETQNLPQKLMISFMWQISQALEHVASFQLVHRDVACRNILLIDGRYAKLADFGLCCHCDDTMTYTASLQKRLPLKWLSVEALTDRIFSEKSDVWSFGICCYEIFSYGLVPYPALSHYEMLEFLQAGNRLEQSKECPSEIYELMLDCWKADTESRPTFKEISQFLKEKLENETSEYGYLALDNSDLCLKQENSEKEEVLAIEIDDTTNKKSAVATTTIISSPS